MNSDIPASRLQITIMLLLGILLWVPAVYAGAGDPVQKVRESADRVLHLLRDNEERLRSEPNYVYDLVEEEILPLVDFEGMSRLILGRHWRTASADQRARFTEAFVDTMVRAYAGQLVEHTDKRIVVNERRSRTEGNRATVATEIVVGQGRANIPVTYDLRLVDGQWKVYNLTVESWNLVTNFRTSFSAEIEGVPNGEMGLERLIQRLERREEDLVTRAVEGQ
jgi:phospholipid transport system substrate-binding protein